MRCAPGSLWLLAGLGAITAGCGDRLLDPVQPREEPGSRAILEVELLAVPDFVDLTASGSLDWVHWGYDGMGGETRKASSGNAIGPLELTIPPDDPFGVRPLDDDFTHYTWTDGAPTETADATTTGVFVTGQGATVATSVLASEQQLELTTYFGGWNARFDIEVSLDGAEPYRRADIVHDAVVPIGVPMRTRFASPEPGARLRVRVAVAEVLDTEGNVAASAATLRVVPP